MNSSTWFAQAIIALLLVVAGAILWRSSEAERRLAAAERDLVMLRYEQAATGAQQPGGRLAALMPGAGRSAADAKDVETTATYWRGDYQAVAQNTDAKLLAANAAYRNMRKTGGSWQAVVGRMDSLIKQYAEILREDPSNAEAAFNYEYVVRLRQVIAARKSQVAPFDAIDQGLTIHGFAGAPPEEADMKKFKMIVPMRPDERLEAEKAGKGTTKVKKG
ncbi:MAG TPA: hypothetical protein VJ691_09700 [Vicinamibacterales bacterium]|nr:hypothetical protein [Vicinamibacterales bacterium]